MKKLPMFLLVFGLWNLEFALATSFPDIKSPVLFEAVNYLNEKGIIKGYPDGTFKPDQVINRAEALKIIFEAVGIEAVIQSGFSEASSVGEGASESEPDSPFPDVPSTQWFATYVSEAKSRGLITGYPDGTYKPTQFVNKAEFMKISMLAQSYYSELPTTNSELPYTDLDPNSWYIPYLTFAFNKEFVDRVSKFNPTAGMTRGEAALIIYRVAKHNESLTIPTNPTLPILSCETCVNGVDLSQYEWSTLPFVKIEDGKVFVDGYDKSDEIKLGADDKNILLWIEDAKLKYFPFEEKLKVDQLYPELYERAIGITGGIQDGDEYLDWPPINKRLLSKDGKIINECDECIFEQALTNLYQNKGHPPFESWIGTDDAKSFIYDVIYGWLKKHPSDAR